MGHLDYDSMGKEFASYIRNTGRVVAADGSVTWYPEYFAKKPIGYSLATIMVSQTKIDVASSKSFKELLPSGSNRSAAGFISYYNQNGTTYSEKIWRAGFVENIGKSFNTIWEGSRPFFNMSSWNDNNMA